MCTVLCTTELVASKFCGPTNSHNVEKYLEACRMLNSALDKLSLQLIMTELWKKAGVFDDET